MGEVPLPRGRVCWRKSSISEEGACLEVASSEKQVWVRDSKNPSGPELGFTRKGWAAFLIGVRCDEFDSSGVST